ncbi:MAG TPA: M28 family peptidase [Thermoanaerobaculia bacterium]
MAEPHHEVEAPSEASPRSAGGALALMLALFGLTLLAVIVLHLPPAPRSAEAPAGEFSAARAREVLRRLAGDGRPHPVGSAADERVRQAIVATLAGLGLQPHIEEGFACHWGGACGRVRNVVARLEGSEPGAAVALTAHYDSVDAGPGVSDDLAGVAAILEIARALEAGPPLRHPVLLLIDEGEEAGLLGASAFEESSAEASDVKAVVNLEARGTSGPSFMFETSGDDGWMLSAWAPRVMRPVTTSLAAAIYSQLPNDTDLTVFRHYHVPGLNFAFIGGATRYHTPDDNLAYASPASLQHQGDGALAAVTGLASSADLSHPPRGNLVFFDLLGLGIARWPVSWMLALAMAALLLVLGATVIALARRTLGGGELVLGLLAAPAMLLATTLLAYGLWLALRAAGPLAVVWLAHPLPALAAFWLLPLAVVAAFAAMLGMGRRGAPLGMWAGIWIVWAALAVAMAFLAPATSYVLVVPVLAAGICGVLGRIWRGGGPATPALAAVPVPLIGATIVPGVVAALLWWGVLPPVYEGLGTQALPIIAVLLSILFATLAPLVTGGGGLGRRLWVLALAATVLAALAAMTQPRFSLQSPQPLTYTFHQDGDSGVARWVVRALPPLPVAVRQAAAFGPPAPAFPWSSAGSVAASAAAPPLAAAAAPPPDLQVLESVVAGGKRHLRLRLLSRRGAILGVVWVPVRAKPESVTIEGHPVPATGWRGGKPQRGPSDWMGYSDVTLPAAGCELDMVLGDTGPLELYAVDITPGLPPAGAALLAARPPTAVPVQQGDTTLVSRKVKI